MNRGFLVFGFGNCRMIGEQKTILISKVYFGGKCMDKIKRTGRGGPHPFVKALLLTLLCFLMVAIGFFGAAYLTGAL